MEIHALIQFAWISSAEDASRTTLEIQLLLGNMPSELFLKPVSRASHISKRPMKDTR